MNTSTKIVGGLAEFKETKTNGNSLLDKIQKAKTKTEIDNLLNTGKSYTEASVKTINKWHKFASKRMSELKAK